MEATVSNVFFVILGNAVDGFRVCATSKGTVEPLTKLFESPSLAKMYAAKTYGVIPPYVGKGDSDVAPDPGHPVHAALMRLESRNGYSTVTAVGKSLYTVRRGSSRWAIDTQLRYRVDGNHVHARDDIEEIKK